MPRLRPLLHVMPLVAAASLGFALWSVANSNEPMPRTPPPLPPTGSVYPEQVAGRGLVEPASEVVAIASELSGIVVRVAVRPGDEVQAGAELFALDGRSRRADVARAEAEAAAARAQVGEIDRQTALQRARIEEAAAEVAAAEAELARADADRDRYARLQRQDFASAQRSETAAADARKAVAGLRRAQAVLASAQAQLAVLEASRARAEADATGAAAAAELARVDLAKMVVRAPIAGTVLTVDLRAGEWVGGATGGAPPLRMGLLQPLHVRVDVDEADAWRIRPGAPAHAQLRGNPAIAADLAFVRVDPFVQPKRSLAASGAERVDTRVLQVVYAVDPVLFPAHVGQQVDVFIAAPAEVPVAQVSP